MIEVTLQVHDANESLPEIPTGDERSERCYVWFLDGDVAVGELLAMETMNICGVQCWRFQEGEICEITETLWAYIPKVLQVPEEGIHE